MTDFLTSKTVEECIAEQEYKYSANKTMELLGHQTIKALFSEDAKNVIDTYSRLISKCPECYTFAADMLNLGIIIGKRQERTKRKAAWK